MFSFPRQGLRPMGPLNKGGVLQPWRRHRAFKKPGGGTLAYGANHSTEGALLCLPGLGWVSPIGGVMPAHRQQTGCLLAHLELVPVPPAVALPQLAAQPCPALPHQSAAPLCRSLLTAKTKCCFHHPALLFPLPCRRSGLPAPRHADPCFPARSPRS